MTKIIYTEQVLNRMLELGYKEQVNQILKTGEHKQRKFANYVVMYEKK